MLNFIKLLILLGVMTTIGEAFEQKDGPLIVGERVKPEVSAIFQIESTTKGYLTPRMTTIQRDAIATPAEGLQIFNTNTSTLQIYGGGVWASIGGGGSDHPLWTVSTGYGIGTIVIDNLTFKVYRTNTGHVSDATLFATDLALGIWDELSDDLDRLLVSVDNTLPRFDGTTGDLIQSSSITIDDLDVMGNLVGLAVGSAATDASSLFDTVSTAQGSRPCPSMTEVQRNGIAAPAGGLCVYNTTTDTLNIYNTTGTVWESAGGGLDKWITGTAYNLEDVIWEPSSNNIYRASTAHTSGVFLTDIANWTELTNDNLTGYDIASPTLGTPTYTTVQSNLDIFHSSGVGVGGDISDDGDGTITVSAGSGYIKATDSVVAALYSTDWAAEAGANVALIDNDLNYIYVEYNAGTPRVIATITERTDRTSNIIIGKVYRSGTDLHVTNSSKYLIGDHAAAMIERLQNVHGFTHESGSMISETGTRNIGISAGSFWNGLKTFTTPSLDTSAAGVFTYYYKDGAGGWTAVAASTQIDNLQYDDSTGVLATLGNNKYGSHWVYQDEDGEVFVLYGQGSYSLDEAGSSSAPSTLPPSFEGHSYIIGRIIIGKSATVFTEVTGAFDTVFQGGSPVDHNDLGNLQGGAALEYYHLDATEFGFLNGQNQSVLTTSTPSFADLTIDNMYLNLNSFTTTSGDLTFAPISLITNVTGSLNVSDNIAGEGGKILGNGPYKQFNQNAYAEFAVVGDFTTGQNATFDGGGTATATPTILTGALDVTDTKYFQYTMGALNDYFYFTLPTDSLVDIGYRFRYSYDGDDDDLDVEIKCATSGDLLTDLNPGPVKASSLTSMTGSVTVPSGCGDLKFGFSVATFNSGKILKFNRAVITDNPWTYKNLVNTNVVQLVGNALEVITVDVTPIPFIGTGTNWDSGTSAYTVINSNSVINISGSVAGSGSAWDVDLYVNGVLDTERIGFSESGITSQAKFEYTGSFTKGDLLVLRINANVTLQNTATRHFLNIIEKYSSENLITAADSSVTTENFLSALSTTTGDKSDLTFTGLQIGQRYLLSGAVQIDTLSGVTNGLDFYSGAGSTGTKYGTSRASKATAGTFTVSQSPSIEFTAVSTTLYATQLGTVNLYGDGTTGSTFLQLTNLTAKFLAAIPTPQVAFIKDVKASGTAGGGFTSGAWQTRVLNTLSGDTSFVTLASNQFTLAPGKYLIEASAPAYLVNLHKVKIYNVSGSSDTIIGSSEYADLTNLVQNTSRLVGSVEITTPTIYALQHRSSATQAATGQGNAASFGVDEIYAQVKITKLR